jgi:hypothetical protein
MYLTQNPKVDKYLHTWTQVDGSLVHTHENLQASSRARNVFEMTGGLEGL